VRHPFAAWLDMASFVTEAQSVIAMRMLRLAGGGAVATSEAQRMVIEKAIANTQAQFAACMTLAAGRHLQAAAHAAAKPYRKKVRANHRRLTRRR
jgi:ribosomal protein S9